MTEWTLVGETESDRTERLRVETGWLYRTMTLGGAAVAMVFVPDMATVPIEPVEPPIDPPIEPIDPPPTDGLAVITPADLVVEGAFEGPAALEFGNGLTGRRDGDVVTLFMFAYDGTLKAFPVPAGASLVPPWPVAWPVTDYGDICQDVIGILVDDGRGGGFSPPAYGLANQKPTGCYLDPVDGRLYWTTFVGYNNSHGVDDLCLGYSTLDHGAHMGTGQAMYKLHPLCGSRFCRGLVPIPEAFREAAGLGTKRLGIGFGGNLSILSNPFSIGPCLLALDAPDPALDEDEAYLSRGLVPLVHYKSDQYRAPRDPALLCYQSFPDAFAGTTGFWNWSDGYPLGLAAVWLHGTTRAGFVVFCPISAGPTVPVTVVGTPAPTPATFAVSDGAVFHVGDFLGVPTDTTASATHYPFCYGQVTAIDGDVVTWGGVTNAETGAPDPAGVPRVGGTVQAGSFYVAGGTMTTRYESTVYLYGESQLGAVAAGSGVPNLRPSSMGRFPLPGQPETWPGSGPNAGGAVTCVGAWHDVAAGQVYVAYRGLATAHPGAPLIYRIAVAA